MSLEGSWDFTVTHKGAVYKCSVDDERIDIAAPSGVTMDAKWNGTALDDWCGWDGDAGCEDEIPQAVLDEAEDRMRGMAESEDE